MATFGEKVTVAPEIGEGEGEMVTFLTTSMCLTIDINSGSNVFKKWKGKETKGKKRKGQERTGKDRKGKDTKGHERTRKDRKGEEMKGE